MWPAFVSLVFRLSDDRQQNSPGFDCGLICYHCAAGMIIRLRLVVISKFTFACRIVRGFTMNSDEPAATGGPQNSSPKPSSFLASEQLLLGIVALQNSLITREQFLASFDAWVQNKNRRLAEILEDQGAIAADDRELLERLVSKFIARHEGDVEKSLAAVSSVSDVKSGLERLGDADIQVTLAHVGNGQSVEDQFATLVPVQNDSFGRFHILRPHAAGGLGQVSVAQDGELNREVALKEIQPRFANDAVSRERFVLEAEITGGLEHPGIVPVYSLGQYADGRPYYAMRFIKGDSLQAAIKAYHDPDNSNRRNPSDRLLDFRQLLGRFIDVCNAIEYAHSRGVLHRDLKPRNIMVGKYGETLVVDWGLAKTLGRKEITHESSTEEATFHPLGVLSSSGRTVPGSALGTPAYMSPEQAAGRLTELGPATDVYSLGATLYHLLTGKPPFDGPTHDVIRDVLVGRFPKPCVVSSDVSPPLEAICLKAMSLNAANRYSSARAFADDVEHWLADEPISAAKDSISERLRRWGRKHKGWVQAGSASLAVIAILATFSALWINAERDEIVRIVAEKSRLAAEKNELAESAQRNLYCAHLNLAQAAWDRNTVAAMKGFLNRYAPGTPLEGLRGYEWFYWNRLGDTARLTLDGHTNWVYSVAFSPDGKQLASGSVDATVKVWDLANGRPTLTLKGHTDRVWSVAFSPDGKRLASGSVDALVKIWDVATGQELLTLKGHTGQVRSVVFGPDGKHLATGSLDNTIKFWDLASGQETMILRGHGNEIRSVAFSADGQRLASGSSDSSMKIWDVVTGKEILALNGHTDRVWSVAFSPDGQHLASGSSDTTVKFWDVVSGQETRTLKGHTGQVRSLVFSPDGKHLASGSSDTTVKVWDVATGHDIKTLKGHFSEITSVAFSPYGKRLASGSGDNTVKLWDVAIGQETLTMRGHSWSKGWTRGVVSVAFRSDGKQVASGSVDQTVKLWDVTNGQETLTLKGHTEQVWSVAFSPDRTLLASGSGDRTIRIWDVASGQETRTLSGHKSNVWSVAFSPDGKSLASGSEDHLVKVWNVATGHETFTLSGHTSNVWNVAFSPDGRHLASGGGDNSVKVWDVASGQETMTLKGPVGEVWSVAFSPDGKYLASGHEDTTVKVWDVVTRQEAITLHGHTD